MSARACAGGGDVMFKRPPSPGHSSRLPNQLLAVLANLMFRELSLKIAQVGVIIQQKCRLVFPWPIPETSNRGVVLAGALLIKSKTH